MKKIFSLFVTLAMLLGSGAVQAGWALEPQTANTISPGNLELVSRFDFTNPLGMVANNDYALIGLQRNDASEVVVLSIADPSSPTYLAAIPFETSGAFPLLLVGNFLYVGVLGGDLRIFDISNPSSPEQVGSYNPIYQVDDSPIAASGDIAYMAHYSGLIVLDISDPAHPFMIGAYSDDNRYSAVAVQGTFVYTIGSQDLYIFECSNPGSPILLGSYNIGSNASLETGVLAVNGNHAYIAGARYPYGMPTLFSEVIDVSNPTHPVKAADLPQLAIMPRQLTIDGSLLYAVHDLGMSIFDAANPLNPQLLGVYPARLGRVVQPQGTRAAYLDREAGFQMVDTSDPGAPQRMGFYSWPQYANHLTAAGTQLYTLATNWVNYPVYDVKSVLQVIDITNPQAPVVSGYATLDAYGVWEIFVAEPYVFVPSVNGLYIVDTSYPVNINSTSIWLNGTTFAVEVLGDTLYALTISWDNVEHGWLSIIDVTDPMSPSLRGEYIVDSYMYDLSVAQQGSATIAYITTQTEFLAINVTNPAAPSLVLEDPSIPEVQRIETVTQGAQTIAYLARAVTNQYASPDEGLVAMNVSDPANPQFLGIYPKDIEGTSMLIAEGDRIYFAESSSPDFYLIDFSDPAAPDWIASVDAPVESWADGSVTQEYICLMTHYATSPGGNIFILSKRSDIQGRVTDHNFQPISGVDLALSSGGSVLTGADGYYSFPDLDFGTYTVTPTLAGFAFFPPSRIAILPGDWTNQDFVVLASPVSTTLVAGITTTLTYTDVQGLPTSFLFPPGTVPITATAAVTPTLVDGFFGQDFTGHAFDLSVSIGVTDTRSLVYPVPVTVTIQYSELDAAVITDTARLALYRWDGGAWVDNGGFCPTRAAFTLQQPGVFQDTICQDGRYALLGPTHGIALPHVYFGSNTGDIPPIH